MTIEYHIPENEQMIDELFAVLSSDDKGEGIVSMMTPHGGMPMIFGHERNLVMMRPLVERMAKDTGKKLIIVKFTKSQILEEF